MARRSSKAAWFCIALGAAPLGTARADDAPPKVFFSIAGRAMLVHAASGDVAVPVGCAPRSFAAIGSTAWVLCGHETVVVVAAEPEPHVVARKPTRARLEALIVDHGTVSAVGRGGVLPLQDYLVREGTHPTPRVLVDDRVRPMPTPPPHVDGFEADLTATNGVGFDGPAGAFTFFDVALIQRFDVPFALYAYGDFGGATGAFENGDRATGPRGGDVQIAVGEALLGVDAHSVAFGFGAGAGLFGRGYDVQPLVSARGRIGAIDEVAFTWHTSFGFNGPTLLGVLGGSIEFHLVPRLWLGADAELGNLRYGRFMADARYRIQGHGPRHVVDLRFGVGLAYVNSSAVCTTTRTGDTDCLGTNVDYLGPAASIGLVWRP